MIHEPFFFSLLIIPSVLICHSQADINDARGLNYETSIVIYWYDLRRLD